MRYLFGALDLLYSSPFRNAEIRRLVLAPDTVHKGAHSDGRYVTLTVVWCLVLHEVLMVGGSAQLAKVVLKPPLCGW